MQITNGIIESARQLASPNCDQRPAGVTVSLLIIHNISLPPGKFDGDHIDQLFSNTLDPNEHPYFEEIKGLKVSAHCLIRRDGELVQYVSLNDRAWHAGESVWCGATGCNDFSIGIELEGCDDLNYEAVQYECLAVVAKSIMETHPEIQAANIVGHSDVAPGRKTDPGPAFDWAKFRRMLKTR